MSTEYLKTRVMELYQYSLLPDELKKKTHPFKNIFITEKEQSQEEKIIDHIYFNIAEKTFQTYKKLFINKAAGEPFYYRDVPNISFAIPVKFSNNNVEQFSKKALEKLKEDFKKIGVEQHFSADSIKLKKTPLVQVEVVHPSENIEKEIRINKYFFHVMKNYIAGIKNTYLFMNISGANQDKLKAMMKMGEIFYEQSNLKKETVKIIENKKPKIL